MGYSGHVRDLADRVVGQADLRNIEVALEMSDCLPGLQLHLQGGRNRKERGSPFPKRAIHRIGTTGARRDQTRERLTVSDRFGRYIGAGGSTSKSIRNGLPEPVETRLANV